MKFVILGIALLLSSCAGGGTATTENGRLIIYTGRDKDEVAAVVRMFQEKFPKYRDRVDTVILGAQAALDRLRAVKSNAQAGFLWGGTLQGLQQAAAEGLLAPSKPIHGDLIDPSRKDPEGR